MSTRARALRHAALILAPGMLLAVLLSIQLSAPWRYIHDDNGAWTQAVASARLRAGFVATKGQDFYLARKDGSLVPYLHHPPLYGTTVAAVYWLTGRADPMTTRLVPAFFHLAGFVGMALLARRLFRRQTAKWTIALSVYALVPMSNYFGKMPFNEPVGLCCIVWALVCLARYRERPSRWTFAGTLAFWVLAGMTSWTAYVILFFVAALLIWEGRAGVRAAASSTRLGATLLLTGVAVGALVILHILWAGNWHLPTMFAAADTWGIHSIGPAGVVKRLAKAFDLHRIYFASVPLLLYLVWIASRIKEARLGLAAISPERRLLLAGSLGCLSWALLILRAISIHAYGQFWYLPFEALAVGDITVELWRQFARRPRLRAAFAVIALIGTLASTAALLHYRYSKPGDYAIRTAAEIAASRYTSPWSD